MNIENHENQGVLNLFNLENTDVMSLECENVNNTMHITVVLNPDDLLEINSIYQSMWHILATIEYHA